MANTHGPLTNKQAHKQTHKQNFGDTHSHPIDINIAGSILLANTNVPIPILIGTKKLG
jgi:hypothetical protein